MARIKNTLSMDLIEVSENLIGLVGQHPRMEIADVPRELVFNDQGNLV
jgi:hypothetical protein